MSKYRVDIFLRLYGKTTRTMDIVTTNQIIDISNALQGTTLHPTAVAYIQVLLTPYAEAINIADNEQVIQWIPLAIPGALRGELLNLVKIETAEPVRNVIIRFLVEFISVLAGGVAAFMKDKTILPWDLQKSIGNNQDLSSMFNITRDDNKLPVTVTVNGQQFTHMLTEEFTMGLLLFSDPLVGNRDFNITLFGTRFTSDYIIEQENEEGEDENDEEDEQDTNRFTRPSRDTPTWYSVEINYTIYAFETPDFMQGFATGAMWAGVDHHNYWTHLFQNTNVRPGEYTGTPINF